MPKIVIVTCDFDYDRDCFTCQESTPWEEVNESDLKILKSYLPYGYRVIEQFPVVEALKTVSQHVAAAKKQKADQERRAKERKLREKELEEKKKLKKLEAAKKLLAQEGILKND